MHKVVESLTNIKIDLHQFETISSYQKCKESINFDLKAHKTTSKACLLFKFLQLIEIPVCHFLFWTNCKRSVLEVRNKRAEGLSLELIPETKNWLTSFMSLEEISPRGREHLIDVATTAALIDRCEKIEDYHIV